MRFGSAADGWLAGPVATLRPTTQASYRNSIETHLRPRWGTRRLDDINADDVAALVAAMRAAGRAESTIATVLRVASQVFKYARRRCGWSGEDPVGGLERGERPSVVSAAKRRIYEGDELADTLRAAREPYRTLFVLAAVTGARLSELLGLVWADVSLDSFDSAEVRFEMQLGRDGRRVPLKTAAARRVVELPPTATTLLIEHGKRTHQALDGFVFATRSGRPLSQRNVLRALRATQRRALNANGQPTFPGLHRADANGQRVAPPRNMVPNFHSFRHTAASTAIAAGDSAEEVAWQLGHKSSVVTRAVYVQEIKNAERKALRRSKLEARLGSILEAPKDARSPRTKRRPTPERPQLTLFDTNGDSPQ